jgi:hypothetical protein
VVLGLLVTIARGGKFGELKSIVVVTSACMMFKDWGTLHHCVVQEQTRPDIGDFSRTDSGSIVDVGGRCGQDAE